jgi:hypothetical protein
MYEAEQVRRSRFRSSNPTGGTHSRRNAIEDDLREQRIRKDQKREEEKRLLRQEVEDEMRREQEKLERKAFRRAERKRRRLEEEEEELMALREEEEMRARVKAKIQQQEQYYNSQKQQERADEQYQDFDSGLYKGRPMTSEEKIARRKAEIERDAAKEELAQMKGEMKLGLKALKSTGEVPHPRTDQEVGTAHGGRPMTSEEKARRRKAEAERDAAQEQTEQIKRELMAIKIGAPAPGNGFQRGPSVHPMTSEEKAVGKKAETERELTWRETEEAEQKFAEAEAKIKDAMQVEMEALKKDAEAWRQNLAEEVNQKTREANDQAETNSKKLKQEASPQRPKNRPSTASRLQQEAARRREVAEQQRQHDLAAERQQELAAERQQKAEMDAARKVKEELMKFQEEETRHNQELELQKARMEQEFQQKEQEFQQKLLEAEAKRKVDEERRDREFEEAMRKEKQARETVETQRKAEEQRREEEREEERRRMQEEADRKEQIRQKQMNDAAARQREYEEKVGREEEERRQQAEQERQASSTILVQTHKEAEANARAQQMEEALAREKQQAEAIKHEMEAFKREAEKARRQQEADFARREAEMKRQEQGFKESLAREKQQTEDARREVEEVRRQVQIEEQNRRVADQERERQQRRAEEEATQRAEAERRDREFEEAMRKEHEMKEGAERKAGEERRQRLDEEETKRRYEQELRAKQIEEDTKRKIREEAEQERRQQQLEREATAAAPAATASGPSYNPVLFYRCPNAAIFESVAVELESSMVQLATQPGFQFCGQFRDESSNSVVMYSRWNSEADQMTYMNTPGQMAVFGSLAQRGVSVEPAAWDGNEAGWPSEPAHKVYMDKAAASAAAAAVAAADAAAPAATALGPSYNPVMYFRCPDAAAFDWAKSEFRASLDGLKSQPGFQFCAQFNDSSSNAVVLYHRWDSEDTCRACMASAEQTALLTAVAGKGVQVEPAAWDGNEADWPREPAHKVYMDKAAAPYNPALSLKCPDAATFDWLQAQTKSGLAQMATQPGFQFCGQFNDPTSNTVVLYSRWDSEAQMSQYMGTPEQMVLFAECAMKGIAPAPAAWDGSEAGWLSEPFAKIYAGGTLVSASAPTGPYHPVLFFRCPDATSYDWLMEKITSGLEFAAEQPGFQFCGQFNDDRSNSVVLYERWDSQDSQNDFTSTPEQIAFYGEVTPKGIKIEPAAWDGNEAGWPSEPAHKVYGWRIDFGKSVEVLRAELVALEAKSAEPPAAPTMDPELEAMILDLRNNGTSEQSIANRVKNWVPPAAAPAPAAETEPVQEEDLQIKAHLSGLYERAGAELEEEDLNRRLALDDKKEVEPAPAPASDIDYSFATGPKLKFGSDWKPSDSEGGESLEKLKAQLAALEGDATPAPARAAPSSANDDLAALQAQLAALEGGSSEAPVLGLPSSSGDDRLAALEAHLAAMQGGGSSEAPGASGGGGDELAALQAQLAALEGSGSAAASASDGGGDELAALQAQLKAMGGDAVGGLSSMFSDSDDDDDFGYGGGGGGESLEALQAQLAALQGGLTSPVKLKGFDEPRPSQNQAGGDTLEACQLKALEAQTAGD